MDLKLIKLGVVLLPGILTQVSFAADSSVIIEVVQPEHLERPPPIYPRSQQRRGAAGAVELSFMVDEQGTTSEIIALRSTNRDFEPSAIAAVSKYIYKPATLYNSPISTRQRKIIYFEIEGEGNAVSRRFSKLYRSTGELLSETEKDKPKIDKLIGKAIKSARTTCEFFYSSLMQSEYSLMFNNAVEKINSIRDLLIFEGEIDSRHKCEEAKYYAGIRYGFIHQLSKSNLLGEALREISILKRMNLASGVMLKVHDLEQLVIENTNKESTVRKLKIPHRGFAIMEIYSNIFSVETIEGKVENLKLRCDTGFVELGDLNSIRFEISKSLGQCQLQIIGEEGTIVRVQEKQ